MLFRSFFILQGPPEATLEYTRAAASALSDSMKAFPETKFVWQVLQTNSGFGGMQTVPWKDRIRTTQQIQPMAYGAVSQIAGLRAFPVLPQPLPGAGQFDVELVLSSNASEAEMGAVAGKLVGAAFASGKFLYADTDLKIDLPQIGRAHV